MTPAKLHKHIIALRLGYLVNNNHFLKKQVSLSISLTKITSLNWFQTVLVLFKCNV